MSAWDGGGVGVPFDCLCESLYQQSFCYFSCERVWSTTHTWGKNEWQDWVAHRAPIDDIIIARHLATPPVPCFRKPFSLLQRRDACCLFWSQFSQLQSRLNYTSCEMWPQLASVWLSIGAVRLSFNDRFKYIHILTVYTPSKHTFLNSRSL